jgi:hypothetical protein
MPNRDASNRVRDCPLRGERLHLEAEKLQQRLAEIEKLIAWQEIAAAQESAR